MTKYRFLPSTLIRVAARYRLAALLAIVMSASSMSYAQALGGITGNVSDQDGLAVTDVEVSAIHDETGVASIAITSSAGVYTIPNLAPGTYTVKFSKAGFQPSVHKGVQTEAARRVSIDARLQAGALTESIEVVAPSVSLETSQPEVGWTMEKKVLEDLPLNLDTVGDRGRQIDALLPLVPGVTGDAFSHRVNGGADMQNEIVFEGVPVAQAETQGFQSNVNPPYDMVQEFRVVGSTFSAQYGLGHGAVSYKFASGTNKFHGSVFEILRNEALNAVGHTPLEAGRKDRDRRHNFGGSLSGPIHIPGVYDGRDKTFFHGTVEWFRLNQPINARLSVPTTAMKAGDFSAFPQPIYVPERRFLISTCTGVVPGQQFPGNRIPENCFSSHSKSVLPKLPDPTAPGFDDNAGSQITNQPTRQTNWGFSLDHNFTAKQKVRFSFWRNVWNQPFCCDNDAFYNNELTGLKDEPRIGRGIFATYSNVFGDSLVMTTGFGSLRETNNEFNQFLGFNFPGVVNSESFPTIDFQGNFSPSDWGAGAGGETYSLNNKLGLSFTNNWLYTRARHTLSFGLEARRASQESQECQRCGGRFNFSSNTTANPAALDSTGSSFASFLLGVVDTADRGFTPRKFLTNFYVAPYIQDEFRIRSNLTLSAGLRWDIMRPFLERDDQFVFMDPTLPNPAAVDPKTGAPLLGAITKLGDCVGCTGYRRAPIKWTQISPRLGVVYRMNEKTVLSTGGAVNRLNGGTFEFGTNKAANDYSGLLAGQYASFPGNQTLPGYGQWDTNPLPAPAAPAFGPTIANGQGTRSFSNDGRAPYSLSWTAGVQRELPWDLLLAVNYVGNRTLHLPSYANPENQLDPKFLALCTSLDPNQCVLQQPWTSAAAQSVLQGMGFGQCDGQFTPYCNFAKDRGTTTALANALRPYPQFGEIRNNFETNGTSLYNAAQLSLQRRFRNGLGFLVAYTLAKSIQNGDDSGFSTFNGQALNKFNPRAEWAVGDNDRRHNLVISGVYEIPIRPTGTLAKNVIGGWQVSGTMFYRSGTPLGLGASGSPLLSGNRPNYDPNAGLNVDWGKATDGYRAGKDENGQVFFPAPLAGEATPYDVFNIAAFSSPGRARVGNAPRRINGLTGNWDMIENLALQKRLYAGSRATAQIRLEFFNIFNRQGFCGVNTNVDDRDRFGLSNARRLRDSQGRVIGVQVSECQGYTPRRGQVFMKIAF